MIFNTASNYSNSLDRDDAPTAPLGVAEDPMPVIAPEEQQQYLEGVSAKDVGMSVPLGIAAANVEGIQAKIRSGVGNLELGFPGAGTGNRNAQTPEMYGKDQRMALREVAKVNDVRFTTHAAYNVMGMTGQDQQGNFANTGWQAAKNEVKRAIDFAADVAGGGSVVVHTGEFERPVSMIYPESGIILRDDGKLNRNWAQDENGRLIFKKRSTESCDYSFQLLDDRTGQVFTTVQGDRVASQPVWLRSKKKQTYKDEKGNTVQYGDYINYEGNLIEDPFNIKFQTYSSDDFTGGRVPDYDSESGQFKTRYMHHDDFEKEALEYNRHYEKVMGKNPGYYQRQTGREMFLKSTLATNASQSRGWALQYGKDVDGHIKAIEELKKLKGVYEKIDANLPAEEKWKILKQDNTMVHFSGGLLPVENKDPIEFINEKIKDQRIQLEFANNYSSSLTMQAEDTMETMRHLTIPEKFVESHGIRGYAESAIHAMEKTKDPENPIFLAMENIFPERFGGHPQELKWLVKKARQKFVDMVTSEKFVHTGEGKPWFRHESPKQHFDHQEFQPGPNKYYKQGMSTEEAKQLAEKHIRATFDTGHANMWRKFYQEDPKLTPDQNDHAFKKWMLTQVEDLAKDGIIGNVHLTDNFGYQDDHLAPGQGNAPVKEVVSILKKYGYNDALTVEPGASASTDQSDFHGLMQTWRHFGSNLYGGAGGPTAMGAPSQSWTNVQNSYFGQGNSPYFVFGNYAPSNDWTLWSGLPME